LKLFSLVVLPIQFGIAFVVENDYQRYQRVGIAYS